MSKKKQRHIWTITRSNRARLRPFPISRPEHREPWKHCTKLFFRLIIFRFGSLWWEKVGLIQLHASLTFAYFVRRFWKWAVFVSEVFDVAHAHSLVSTSGLNRHSICFLLIIKRNILGSKFINLIYLFYIYPGTLTSYKASLTSYKASLNEALTKNEVPIIIYLQTLQNTLDLQRKIKVSWLLGGTNLPLRWRLDLILKSAISWTVL